MAKTESSFSVIHEESGEGDADWVRRGCCSRPQLSGAHRARRGDQKKQSDSYAQASEFAGAERERRRLGMIEQNRGVLARMRGDFAKAAGFYSTARRVRDGGRRGTRSWVLNNLEFSTQIRNFRRQRAVTSSEDARSL